MKEITVEELKEKMDQGKSILLIDVREDEEVQQGVIPGAKHLAMSGLPDNLEEFVDQIKGFEGDCVLYCKAGARSEKVAQFIESEAAKDLNLRELSNLLGGYLDWEFKITS